MQNNQSHKYYFDHPEIWEKLRTGSLAKEKAFLSEIIKKNAPSATRVLDVGCGIGSHCEALNSKGFETIGVDINPHMIAFAKSKYPNLDFEKMDMRQLNQSKLGMFDVILCLCTSFTYNTTTKQIIATLKSFHRLLNPGGLLILEFFNPISFLEKNKFQGSFFQEDLSHYHKIGLDLKVIHRVDEKRQLLLEDKKIYSLETGKLLSSDKTEFRLIFPQELVFYLETMGFIVKNQFGRYDTGYTKLDRTKLITVATKNG